MPNLPRGTITFLFTDIAGSTRLWEEAHDAMRSALIRHDTLLYKVIEEHDGVVFKTVGDSFCAAFNSASDALAAALTAQRTLLTELWPEGAVLRVRMALHTGQAEERDGDYFGPPLNRVARLLAIGYGGQVLLSQATRDLIAPEVTLAYLGRHRLKDLQQPEPVWQLLHADLPTDFPSLHSLTPEATNLPVQTTSFIGREKELLEVKALLGTNRLLTLTGSGGCGKTRLALQVSADLVTGEEDGVWLVELASLADSTLLTQTVASVLGVREESDHLLLKTLSQRLASKRLLLLLDNCEHILDSVSSLVNTLLQSCPQIRIIATSREPLGVAGEVTFRVPSLGLPDLDASLGENSLVLSEAARLFVERARQFDPAFSVTPRNAAALARLCHRLDGIPLAIELAAARVRALPVEQLEGYLHDRFRLLTGGSRTALPRHQTLRALIDWSYALLNAQEQKLLRRLSVLAGEWTVEAASAICSDEALEPGEVLIFLLSLVDKSLVQADTEKAVAHYRLLETVRQYARDRLMESGEGAAVRQNHLAYFLRLAEEAALRIHGPEQAEWLEMLEATHDNLRAALAWCMGGGGDAEVAQKLAGATGIFWSLRGHLTEGRRWLEESLFMNGASNLTRARALYQSGHLARNQGDLGVARTRFEESLKLYREEQDQVGAADQVHSLGMIAHEQGDYVTACTCYEESLALYRLLRQNDRIRHCLMCLGIIAANQRDHALARRYYSESLSLTSETEPTTNRANLLLYMGRLCEREGNLEEAGHQMEQSLILFRALKNRRGCAEALHALGLVWLGKGELEEAYGCFRESLRLFGDIGDRWGVANVLEELADIAARNRQAERAARLWGAAHSLRMVIGSPLTDLQRDAVERQMLPMRASLGEAAFNAVWSQGQLLSMEAATAYALETAV